MNSFCKTSINQNLKEIIDKFEDEQFRSRKNQQERGIVYTPLKLAHLITRNIIKICLIDLINEEISLHYQYNFSFESFKQILHSLKEDQKKKIWREISKFKILDPSCGTGRFLIAIAKILCDIFKILQPDLPEQTVKLHILKNNVFGVELDLAAVLISKVRLLEWYLQSSGYQKKTDISLNNIREEIKSISKSLKIQFNLFSVDFLTEFNFTNFNIIIGNPPYIENKKINEEYKKKIKKFKSAFGLYDLSIIFIEKSLDLLNSKFGYLSFIITNKFLAADYGKKIRAKILNETQILHIDDISSLSVFSRTSVYPIIISMSKKSSNPEIFINLLNSIDLDDLEDLEDKVEQFTIPQQLIRDLPLNVIPITQNSDLIRKIYRKHNKFSDVFENLNIVYRPFGFIKWAENFAYVNDKKKSDNDMVILGTGNVGKYHIKFEKPIRIANKKFRMSYFNYTTKFEERWSTLQSKKLLIREVAKEITACFDPGIFTNLTGLYSIILPSFNINQYFSLLTILNSKIMNLIFDSLYGTLHMSGGYLRYNASFIKQLPIPGQFPSSLFQIGKILQFLYQLKYERKLLQNNEIIKELQIKKLLDFYTEIANNMVQYLYLPNSDKETTAKLLYSKNVFPNIKFKYFLPRFNLQHYRFYKMSEIEQYIDKIIDFYDSWIK